MATFQKEFNVKHGLAVNGIVVINGNGLISTDRIDGVLLPDQTGANGKFLSSDGINAFWQTIDLFPDQTGQDGKFLTTNSGVLSWETVDLTSLNASYLTSGTISTERLETISGLVAGSYGSGSAIPVVGVDNKGRITSISTAAVDIPTGLTSGSSSVGFIQYNGVTPAIGQWYGNTTDPSNTTRLNYDGYIYATKLYSNATEVSVSGHTHSYVPLTSLVTGGNTFNSTTGVAISHSMGAPSAYSVSITPTSNGGGYIGEWYVVKGTNTMTVYCTGSTTTTTFDYFIKLV